MKKTDRKPNKKDDSLFKGEECKFRFNGVTISLKPVQAF